MSKTPGYDYLGKHFPEEQEEVCREAQVKSLHKRYAASQSEKLKEELAVVRLQKLRPSWRVENAPPASFPSPSVGNVGGNHVGGNLTVLVNSGSGDAAATTSSATAPTTHVPVPSKNPTTSSTHSDVDADTGEYFDPEESPIRYTDVIQSPTRGGIGPRWQVAAPPEADARFWVPETFPNLSNDTVSCRVKNQLKEIFCSDPFNMDPAWNMKQHIDAIEGRLPPYITDTLRKLNKIRNHFEHPEGKPTPPTLGIPHLYWQDVKVVMTVLEHVQLLDETQRPWWQNNPSRSRSSSPARTPARTTPHVDTARAPNSRSNLADRYTPRNGSRSGGRRGGSSSGGHGGRRRSAGGRRGSPGVCSDRGTPGGGLQAPPPIHRLSWEDDRVGTHHPYHDDRRRSREEFQGGSYGHGDERNTRQRRSY